MFQFKQFTVHQDQCAMKVCTDACLFGAMLQMPDSATSVLDIGTGTGLLSLMLAQRYSKAQFTAVEIDPLAANQAQSNVAASPWATRIQVQNESIQTFANQSNTQFDVIVSNPPFFNNHLESPAPTRNAARHQILLPFDALAEAVQVLLKPDGVFWVLLPPAQMLDLQLFLNRKNMFIETEIRISNFQHQAPFRNIAAFRHSSTKIEIPVAQQRQITIYKAVNQYTPEFTEWLAPYYLYL